MKKSVTKNYVYNLIYQILILILPIITTPYISRVLGAENIGIYSYTISISAYFILFGSLGVALYGQREVAYYQKDVKSYTRVFWEIVIFRAITMLFSLLIFGFSFVYSENYSIYYKILILEIIATCFDISWFFQGLEEFKKTVVRNIVVKIFSVVCIFLFVKTNKDLFIYFWIYVLSVIIGNISLWFYLPKYLIKIKIRELHLLRHIKPTISLFIPQIAIKVYTLLDRTMIGAFIEDKSEVGYYEQSEKIIKMLLTIITSLGTVMMPRIANMYGKGKREEVMIYMKKSFNLVFLLAFPIIFGIIAISQDFVPVFFGAGYEKVAVLISVISPIILFIALSNVTGTQYLLPTKRQKEYTISVVSGAILNCIMNYFLIRDLGAVGAAIGTVVAEFMVTIVQLYFVREDFKFKEIAKLSINYIFASLIMFFVCVVIGRTVNNSLYSTIYQLGAGCLIYFICLLILKDKFVLEVLNRIRNNVMGKNSM